MTQSVYVRILSDGEFGITHTLDHYINKVSGLSSPPKEEPATSRWIEPTVPTPSLVNGAGKQGRCDPGFYECRSGHCLDVTRWCDNIPDCPDQDDESSCRDGGRPGGTKKGSADWFIITAACLLQTLDHMLLTIHHHYRHVLPEMARKFLIGVLKMNFNAYSWATAYQFLLNAMVFMIVPTAAMKQVVQEKVCNKFIASMQVV